MAGRLVGGEKQQLLAWKYGKELAQGARLEAAGVKKVPCDVGSDNLSAALA